VNIFTTNPTGLALNLPILQLQSPTCKGTSVMIKNISDIHYFENQWQSAYNFSQLHPYIYNLITGAIALLGYGILLLFPGLFVYGAWQTLTLHIDTYSVANLAYPLFWFTITVYSGFVSMKLSKLKFRQVEGVQLSSTMTIKLQFLLDKISEYTAVPRVDNIVISEQISIDLVKIPRFPLPFWSTNTLVIGLPLMQCLSPEYFECAVIRKLLQHSKQTAFFSKWLHQLRSIWLLYALYFSTKSSLSCKILSLLFRLYTPFYRDLAVPIANRVELLADQDTLLVVNDEDLLQTIEKVVVTKIFMDKEYWPRIAKMQKQGLTLSLEPYSLLEDTLKSDLTNKSAKRWLDSLYEHESHRMHALPSLRTRMNNIGRCRIRIPEKTLQTAATYYLDNDYTSVISSVNQLWLQRNSRLASSIARPNNQNTPPPVNTPISPTYRANLMQ